MDRQKILDLSFKVISSFLAIGTFGYGIVKYSEQKEIEFKQNEQKFRQTIYVEQYALYSQAVECAAIIATTEEEDIETEEFINAKRKFEQLYWGKLNMVEDTAVERTMVKFYDALKEYGMDDSEKDSYDMQQLSLEITYACRKSLQKTWGVELPELGRSH